MLDREFLDRVLPDVPGTWELVSKITGIDFVNRYRSATAWRVHDGLEWLAKLTEKDRHAITDVRPDWKVDNTHPLYDPGQWTWPIRLNGGLEYKSKSEYLTNIGWHLRETCWFVRLEAGSRYIIAAETQHLAVGRAIIVAHAMLQDRVVAPKLRKLSLEEVVVNIVAEVRY